MRMKFKTNALSLLRSCALGMALLGCVEAIPAQTLINVDFGVGSQSRKVGFAAIGQATNDFWNLFRLYDPKYTPGMPLMAGGTMKKLKLADGSGTEASISVSNAPGVWGNWSGDPMFDSYIFAQNSSNIEVTVTGLEPGSYHFYLYGHAEADAAGEQNSIFWLQSAKTNYGPASTAGSAGWKASSPWQEGGQYIVFRDVEVREHQPVTIAVAPGPKGIAVLNGLQISSRGTSPPRLAQRAAAPLVSNPTNLFFREIRYVGTVSDSEAHFSVDLDIESMTTNAISTPLFQGDVAVMLPAPVDGVQIVREGGEYCVRVMRPGRFSPHLEVVAKITRAEPWNQIYFCGPSAAIASIRASATNEGVELQLLSGTLLEEGKSKSRVEGFLNSDQVVSLRWQGRAAEVSRKALITVDTSATARLSPTVVKLTTEMRYEILQAALPRLAITLPAGQALTRLQGEQIRDWKIDSAGTVQTLTIEFIKPVEKNYNLTLYSEQPAGTGTENVLLTPPQPAGVERESGTFTLFAEDTLVEIVSISGVRQVNAPAGALAAYRFHGRPLLLTTRVRQIEPVIKVADRVGARVEEARLLVTHSLGLTVEKAGVYALELVPQPGMTVAEVKGEGVEDWKATGGLLHVNFSSRVLGERRIEVQLEQPLRQLPPRLTILPMRAPAASKESAQIGVAVAPGLRAKTSELLALSEIPANQLASPSDELLAFNSQEPGWSLGLATERLPARIVAEVFNLITIGDGLVGGSATVRYTLINQGVQQFRLKVPAHWKNVEFTGPNIRGKEQSGDIWTINLQDKAWDAYTLVVTYDHQFDSTKAVLDAAGLHAPDAEHETGSVAITTAASLKVQPAPAQDPLRQIDPSELAESDRALITRPVLLAYRYSGEAYTLGLGVTRHEEEKVLDAVADRTQLTTVITDGGEMLTQASFMVKNNDRQYQRFQLPSGATFWGCYVNGNPSKAEKDGPWLLVSLPRGANRDEAFAVDLVYRQTTEAIGARVLPKTIEFLAPKTTSPIPMQSGNFLCPRTNMW